MRGPSSKNRAATSAKMKELWQDPAYRERFLFGLKKAISNSSEARRGKPPAQAQLLSLKAGREKNWQNPDYRNKMSRVSSATLTKTNATHKMRTESARQKSREFMLQQWASGKIWDRFKRRADGFRSRPERQFADELLSKGLTYRYEPKRFVITLSNGTQATYLPDFYIEELDWWIEIKGWWYGNSFEKVSCFMKQYPNLTFSVLDSNLKTLLGKAW